MTAELPPSDAQLELARLRAPNLVYILDAEFRITFSSEGDLPNSAASDIEQAVREIGPTLETGEYAAWPLDQTRIIRAQRLAGQSSTAYVVFVENISRT